MTMEILKVYDGSDLIMLIVGDYPWGVAEALEKAGVDLNESLLQDGCEDEENQKIIDFMKGIQS